MDASILNLGAALGCGLTGGVYFAFSTFVMKALGRVSSRCAVASMQSINVAVLNPWFLGAFLATAVLCVLGLIATVGRLSQTGSGWTLAGSVLYLTGSFLVTVAANVPRNETLARLRPDHPDHAAAWNDYHRAWSFWNHIRTAASLGAAVAFAIALRAEG